MGMRYGWVTEAIATMSTAPPTISAYSTSLFAFTLPVSRMRAVQIQPG